MITPEQAVDAVNERFGRHAGYRALHAKGLLLKGSFTATSAAAALTRAAHMQGEPVPVTVRFSNGSGDLRGAAAALKPPASYGTRIYYAIHAFLWIDAGGGERHVRYRWVPEGGEQNLSGGEAKQRGADYLQQEIGERLGRGPVRFNLELQLVRDGDPVDDPTAPWREDRETIVGGTLELTEFETGRETGGDVLVFDPTRVTDGIELTDDPILRFRSPAYSVSIERRSGITRPR